MSETKIAGIAAKHLIITTQYRENKTAIGAFEEVVEKIRESYLDLVKSWENYDGEVDFHFVLTIEK